MAVAARAAGGLFPVSGERGAEYPNCINPNNNQIKNTTMSTPTIIIDKLSYILNAENHTATLSECLDKEVKYIAIPETITYKEVVYSVTRLGHLAFNRCSIEQVSIPNSVQYIEDNAFADCVNLVSVTIPDSITRIDEWTFTGCCSLMNIVIPNTITSIGRGAFCGCIALTDITIPNSVTSIGSRVFWNCKNLQHVELPQSLTYIPEKTFIGCSSLQNIIIPDSVERIGSAAFRYCKSLTDITIPNGVKVIGFTAFECCESLTSISIPEGVERIEGRAFQGCKSLISVTFPTTITGFFVEKSYMVLHPKFWEKERLIGTAGIFEKCPSLAAIYIPQGMTEKYCSLGLEMWRDKIVER